jgi:hypothetical protein
LLYVRLAEVFPADDLFMDVEGSIKPGDDFVQVLNAHVTGSDVLLAVIGPRWTELLAARANDLNDFVAIEIKAALENDKRVIPVLVGGAVMPDVDTLPEAIRPLARRNAVGLRPERFHADCQGLISALEEQFAAAAAERARAEPQEEPRVPPETESWRNVQSARTAWGRIRLRRPLGLMIMLFSLLGLMMVVGLNWPTKNAEIKTPSATTPSLADTATKVYTPTGDRLLFNSRATMAFISDSMTKHFGPGTLESVETGGYRWRRKTEPSPTK